MWQGLSHPHLLPFLGIMIDGDIALVSPFVENGSVPDYLFMHPGADRPKFVSPFLRETIYRH